MASGDVVNTAARLQAQAPVNGILTDATTYRLTRAAVEFQPTEAIVAKGKTEPIAAWEVVDARSRLGSDVTHHARTGLVGRERELSVLRDALDRARFERIPQLVTIVGVPGIGKSRLVHELSRIADADTDLITWRQGRCLAYGDGAAFWALAEIVKAHSGILEQDSEAVASDKLRDDDRRGRSTIPVRRAGSRHICGRWSASGPTRASAATAAARPSRPGGGLSRRIAEQRPLVLVIEDLHWADDGLLDFIDDLVGWLTDVPLLVIGTARPELLERRPGWGGGKLNSSTLALTPLSSDQTAVLLADALGRVDLPDDVERTLIDRADGNPLYAEQFAQLYLEQGPAASGAMPETLTGIVSARLDTLSVEEKAALQDGAVMGKVFWTGAVNPSVESGTAAAGPRAQGVPDPPAALVGRAGDRVVVRAHAHPGRLLRPDPARRPERQAPPRGGVDRPAGPARGPCRPARSSLGFRVAAGRGGRSRHQRPGRAGPVGAPSGR